MPKRGDKLYGIWKDTLQIVTFLEESIAEGAAVTTWVVQDVLGRKARCPTTMYCKTESEAWSRELDDCRKSLPQQIKKRDEINQDIEICHARILTIELRLKTIAYNEMLNKIEHLLGITERTTDFLDPEDYAEVRRISADTADLRLISEGDNPNNV